MSKTDFNEMSKQRSNIASAQTTKVSQAKKHQWGV